MARAYPPDVLVLDFDAVVHARVARGGSSPQITHARSYRLPEGTFRPGIVSPEVGDEAALAEVIRRIRMERGRLDQASLLLPDAWFRMNLNDVPSLPSNPVEAQEVVRWSLKRSLPIPPENLRIVWQVLRRNGDGVRLLIVSAVEATLASLERTVAAAGVQVSVVEPVGLNIWNAITVREEATTGDRLLVYVRESDFTTALFRGTEPLFLRSRNLSGDRSVQQEIRLSATYLRETVGAARVEQCYLTGNDLTNDLEEALRSEFDAPVRRISARDVAASVPGDAAPFDSELVACTGVFAS